MNKKATLLMHLCYWSGAIFDAVVIIPLLSPQVAGARFGIPEFNPGVAYRYATGVGAALMAGWTVLLLWADRKPWERRGILLITLFPVLTGLILAGIDAVNQGLFRPDKMMPTWIIQGILGILFIVVYIWTQSLRSDLQTGK